MNVAPMSREAFILSFWKYAYALAHKYSIRIADIDDLAQEALLAVCRCASLDKIADAYVHTAMIHAIYDYLKSYHYIIKPEFAVRHRQRQNNDVIIDNVPLSSIDVDTVPEDTRSAHDPDWQWLYDLANLLSPTQKRVIGYRFGLGCEKLEIGEIAKLCGYSSTGSVESAKDRALENLRKGLDPSYEPRSRRNEQLRNARLAHGWTTVETGKLLQMSTPRNYECWERNGARPSEENMLKLCKLFGMTSYELGFGGPDAS